MRETVQKHGKKIAGVSAVGIVVWCVAQFPSKREFDELRHDVHQIHTMQLEQGRKLNEVHTQVVVLDALRRNEQADERDLYE